MMNVAKLEGLLGYRFKDISLLARALTHRSWTHENWSADQDNESLEFVGDSVLGMVIAEQLFKKHPDLTEGDLTLMKHRLVSMPTLAKIAAELRLGEFVRIGRGEERSGGREKPAIAADALEAVIAAVFLDGGYIEARSFVAKVFADELRSITPDASHDHKTMLQELLQAKRLSAPKYSLLRSEGPPHNRTFFVEAVWDGGRTEGVGRSLKAAEMNAAELALEIIADGAVREAKS